MTRTADIREAENRGLEKAALYLEEIADDRDRESRWYTSAYGKYLRWHASDIRAMKEET